MAFSDKKVLFLLLKSKQKVTVKIMYFNEGFVCNRTFNNRPAVLSENSTNSLKVETKTNGYL